MADSIKRKINSNEGRLSILDMVEEIPYEIRAQVIESLSAFHEQYMVTFYYLLKVEYGEELAAVCDRALEKYRMLGMNISPPIFFEGRFIKTYASISRHTGRITLDVAWDTGKSGIHVECFYLTFKDGVYSFVVLDNISAQIFESDRKMASELTVLNFEETCFLLQEAFSLNITQMSRPALGKFMYQKYLKQDTNYSFDWIKRLIRKTSCQLTPRQVINSLFNALNQNDITYIFALLSDHQLSPSLFFKRFAELLNPDTVLLEGEVIEVSGSRNTARVKAQVIREENHRFYRSEYIFYMLYESGYWTIGDIERISYDLIDPHDQNSLLGSPVYCRVYRIADWEGVFDVLDRIDNIRECQELPGGTHLRINYYSDNFNKGVSFMSGVIADIVINGDELIVFTPNKATIKDIHGLFTMEQETVVITCGDYEVNLITAYSYLGGQSISFEDMLQKNHDCIQRDDGMRFFTTRYLIKNRKRVLERIEALQTVTITMNDGRTLYYKIARENHFFVEYLLGSNWVSVSTFTEQDMALARQEFEDQMYDYLEFDGMVVSNEGFFDILTTEIKREYPELEMVMKEIYLDKWYHSHLVPLSGMSPSEACQSEEGSRLLWTMFKNLKRKKSKAPYLQSKRNLDLKEYIRKVEQKNEGKQ